MPDSRSASLSSMSTELTEAVIRIGLIAFLVFMCARVFSPFADLMLWALILAIALYPVHQALANLVGGRSGLAAALVVSAGLLLLGGPTAMLGSSLASQVQIGYMAYEKETLAVPQSAPKVAEWPVVGKQVHAAWSAAADNLPVFLKKNQEQIASVSKSILAGAASVAGSALMFMGALIIAGVMMAYGKSGSRSLRSIFQSLAGPARGSHLQTLSTETVRSVANGVIGVAFIQALLIGIGLVLAGIPVAGVLAFFALLLGIAQLPGALVTLPAIAYMWWLGDGSTAGNIFFTVYLIAASMADNVLKPLLLGRGVEAPMPIILLGAMGGMITSGIIGLFVGAVLLTIGYKVFMEWVGPVGADLPEDDIAQESGP